MKIGLIVWGHLFVGAKVHVCFLPICQAVRHVLFPGAKVVRTTFAAQGA